MPIGVLVEVISMVASTEKEGMAVSMVASRMRSALRAMGRDDATPLSKMDFQELLVQPDVTALCQEIGVNLLVLVDMSDVIYESIDKDGKGMSFGDLVEVVLNMRGTNVATVKDVKEQLRAIKGLVHDAQSATLVKVAGGFEIVGRQVH